MSTCICVSFHQHPFSEVTKWRDRPAVWEMSACVSNHGKGFDGKAGESREGGLALAVSAGYMQSHDVRRAVAASCWGWLVGLEEQWNINRQCESRLDVSPYPVWVPTRCESCLRRRVRVLCTLATARRLGKASFCKRYETHKCLILYQLCDENKNCMKLEQTNMTLKDIMYLMPICASAHLQQIKSMWQMPTSHQNWL